MIFAELLQEVYNLTTRDDLVDLTKSAVKAATLKAHQTDFYSKDIFEGNYAFPTAAYHQSFDVYATIPNYRALKYLRRYENSTDALSKDQFFTVITPEEVLNRFNDELTDVCYVAGRVIELKASVEFTKFIIGCYVNPVVTEVNYSSWVADLYPYAIVHEAARVVFATIALQTEANAQKELVAEQYAELKINALSDYGY